MAQMVRAMRAIMSMESLGNNALASAGQSRIEDGQKTDLDYRRSTSEDEIDALEVSSRN